MTTFRSPKPPARPSLPLIAATTAALPAVVLSSLAVAQPASAESRSRSIPATLAAAMRAQAQGVTPLVSAMIPAASVSAAIPTSLRPTQATAPAEYTIERGDTISGIAGKFGLDTYAVLALNNLQANTIIYPGQKIQLGGNAPAPAPAAQPSAPESTGTSYTVEPGDTLGAIAARHGVQLAEVLGWNGLNLGSIIYPGQKITIGAGTTAPSPSAPAAPAPAATPAAPASGSYTIKAGDTLSGIAARNGVKLTDILSANRLTMSTIIYPGQKLVLAGGSSIAPASSQTPATVTPLVPSTFLGFTYPAAVVSSANQNKALLNAAPVPSREQMKSIVADTARRMGVDASLALAFALQESGFDQRAVSPANAIGTMQVIPSSGEWASDLVGRQLNLLDPYDNAVAGVAIIRQLVRTSSDLDNAIAGYYQGQYSVSTYGMYEDTKQYVAAIKAHQKNVG
ncbi:LysM repeat protein [Arthrobacter sp. V4I6]|uniref:lytic transglycosylase domain-containing protein n=1 Tax=unclassified Arthrobacter TaxID=235627 RepID=UPI00277EA7CC|nr:MULTISPECIES: lytic transglycosylase domain-containing protein [unclassified Arthrobacter]MDQ0821780.1 LysM repeat protein [Arthrobacter sp. V1I7]MDQ0856044.1 LysM repeat protein [Arthrobacter sp. V4I6]